ncbi:MAG: universal stress protein [Acidimicrobiia bacterium]|nr:universal stress protein [Acidimicrobiia bacterium]
MKHLVVGLDGSPASRRALRLAATLAGPFGATVRAVEAWEFTPLGALTGRSSDPDELQRAAQHRVERVAAEELGAGPTIDLECVAVEADAADALVAESAGADLVLVGSRGLGGFSGLLVGSVSQKVVHHGACPVVVVHPDPDHTDTDADPTG